MLPTPKQYVYAYRGLYRALLHAVQYAKPARYMGRNMLRDEFRKGNPETFDQIRIDNTIKFLKLAAKETGLEHKEKTPMQKHLRQNTMTHYDKTIEMLNESMGLCLR
ncbi:hypothetical protein SS1G_10205 [Sclerotinia sclerotiorum 1980 UF-70]|uniref:Mitochondrial zinc maintenance protein 1, mitochondrial n=1 Tax=Sclerotinia sclerotiorum (strain ATCC 18683 / 1980 / Ss-1) TaxID=665079 RepID=A7EXZ0_SCLS1|nr:hypothetical protein SS1G_10205 [Sclerotinia sclerotiorum 1980 UF-70]EDN94332.1 hypothetical protein SS1G_10205 [Sclerotinia sclerotiorum 1980 UF-70]